MDWVVIEGFKPYDGRYPLDNSIEFTNNEWRWIKRLAGYMPLTVEEGFDGGDSELFTVLALIALRRAGKIGTDDVTPLFERMGDVPTWSTIRLESDQPPAEREPGDAGPPDRSSSVKSDSNGDDSPGSSETSTMIRNGSGIPVSATSAFDPTTWAT